MAAERAFSIEDQRLFATLSGDRNPKHVDPLYARRLFLGKAVVHGIHSLLWGLDEALADRSPMVISAIEAKFLRPISLGKTVRAAWAWRGSDLELEAHLGKELVFFAKASFGALSLPAVEACPGLPPDGPCRELDRKAMQAGLGQTLSLFLDPGLGKRLFPRLMDRLPSAQLAGLLLASRTIGMHCPGLHSLFSGLKLSRPEAAPPGEDIGYCLERFDERFSHAAIAFSSPMLAGRLMAFHHPEPATQLTCETARLLVGDKEFSGIKGLVVGGSRGLGEATAKLLAAGGADVRLTYFRGEEEATRLTREILGQGGRCAHYALDINAPAPGMEAILADGWRPSDLYYFPTPPIFEGRAGSFSPSLYESFTRYYIYGFMAVLDALKSDSARLRVLYPSTVAVEEHQPGMAEYASVKAAGENLCANLSGRSGGLKIFTPRLPRLRTDQTASLYPVENKEPAPILLDILRQMIRCG